MDVQLGRNSIRKSPALSKVLTPSLWHLSIGSRELWEVLNRFDFVPYVIVYQGGLLSADRVKEMLQSAAGRLSMLGLELKMT